MPPPNIPGNIPTNIDAHAALDGAGALLQLSPARDGKGSGSQRRRSPARPRRASFAANNANKFLTSPKRSTGLADLQDSFHQQNPDEDWQQASTAAAMILSGLSPLSTPVKGSSSRGGDGQSSRGNRSPGQAGQHPSGNPVPYSPFSTFAKQLSPLVTMGGNTPAILGQKNTPMGGPAGSRSGSHSMQNEPGWGGAYQLYQDNFGVTPSPMRAAIANGALSMAAGLLSPAPDSENGLPSGRNGGRVAGRIGRPLAFGNDDSIPELGGNGGYEDGSKKGKSQRGASADHNQCPHKRQAWVWPSENPLPAA